MGIDPLGEFQFQPWTSPFTRVVEYTLDDNGYLADNCPLDNNNGKLYRTSRTSLGILELFPLEVMADVFVQLDLRSLTDFR